MAIPFKYVTSGEQLINNFSQQEMLTSKGILILDGFAITVSGTVTRHLSSTSFYSTPIVAQGAQCFQTSYTLTDTYTFDTDEETGQEFVLDMKIIDILQYKLQKELISAIRKLKLS